MRDSTSLVLLASLALVSLPLVGCSGSSGGPNGAGYVNGQQQLNTPSPDPSAPADGGSDWSYTDPGGDSGGYDNSGDPSSSDTSTSDTSSSDSSGDTSGGDSSDASAVADTFVRSGATAPAQTVVQVTNDSTATISVAAKTVNGVADLGSIRPGETVSAHLDGHPRSVTLSARAVTADANGVVPVLHDVTLWRRPLHPRGSAGTPASGAAWHDDGSATTTTAKDQFARVVYPPVTRL